MTLDDYLVCLLDRFAAFSGKPAIINTLELANWPAEFVVLLKTHNLLQKTKTARSVVCTKCEEECVRPVESRSDNKGGRDFFLICELQSDVHHIPVFSNELEQWQIPGGAIAQLLNTLLHLRKVEVSSSSINHWEVGLFKGNKHNTHIALVVNNDLCLSLAGRSIVLSDVLAIEDGLFTIDKRAITRLVDKPTGVEDVESVQARQERIRKRVEEEKAKGNTAFLKTVAEEENLSTSRIKQLIKEDKPATKKLW